MSVESYQTPLNSRYSSKEMQYNFRLVTALLLVGNNKKVCITSLGGFFFNELCMCKNAGAARKSSFEVQAFWDDDGWIAIFGCWGRWFYYYLHF